MIGFLLCFFIELEDFLSIKPLVFLLVFSLSLGNFLPLDIHGFFFNFPLGLRGFFPIDKDMISNSHMLVGACINEKRQL